MGKESEVPGTQLAVIETPEAAIAALRGQIVPEVSDPAEVQRQIMERILSATSPEEVLGGNTGIGATDVLGRPFTLHGLKVMKSRFQDAAGPKVFVVLDAEFGDDGSRKAVTTSALNVMTGAIQLWRLDALPRNVVIRQSDTPTASGYNVLYLESA